MKKMINIIVKYIKIFSLILIMLLILMTLSSLIPSNFLKKNIQESAEDMLNRGECQAVSIDVKKPLFKFIYTDALMLNTAYSIDNKKPLESFLLARKNYIPGITKTIHTNTPNDLPTAEKYLNDKYDDNVKYQIMELYDTSYSNELYESFEYARYWHGYLIFLRPLLVIFNYSQIGIILTIRNSFVCCIFNILII